MIHVVACPCVLLYWASLQEFTCGHHKTIVRQFVCTSLHPCVLQQPSELLPNTHMVDLVLCEMIWGFPGGFVDVLVWKGTATNDHVECAEVCRSSPFSFISPIPCHYLLLWTPVLALKILVSIFRSVSLCSSAHSGACCYSPTSSPSLSFVGA